MKFLILSMSVLFCGQCLTTQSGPVSDKFSFGQTTYIVVETTNGFVKGATDTQYKIPVHVFKGIPYAEPPVGDLRFKRPVRMARNWTGTYDADRMSFCAQNMNGLMQLNDEDCLHLNVWVPVVNKTNVPVLIVIHGGALSVGGTNTLDATQLAQRGMIVVAPNYRLGVFGFLYSGTDDAPGNQGLWDQAMAMEWVIENIGRFGGNPNDVTLMGESAGGWCITIHAVSPITRNYFQKAVIISGSAYAKYMVADNVTGYDYSRRYADKFGVLDTLFCGNSRGQFVECLRRKSTNELNEKQSDSNFLFGRFFRPVFGDEFLPEHVFHALKTGHFNSNASFLLGHMEMEGLFFAFSGFDPYIAMKYNPAISFFIDVNPENVQDDIKNKFVIPIDNVKLRERVAQMYTKFTKDKHYKITDRNELLRSAAMHALGDFHIACPTVLFGVNLVQNPVFNGNVYQFRLTYSPSTSPTHLSQWAGTTHTEEYFLLFGQPFDNTMSMMFNDNDRTMSRTLMDTVKDFVKTGYPAHEMNFVWPKYTKTNDTVIASYVEMNPEAKRFRKKHSNPYKGNDGYVPNVINDCINFWQQVYEEDFSGQGL